MPIGFKLYDLGGRQGPFSYYGQTEANSAGKELKVTNINAKAGPPKLSNRPTTK